MLAGKCVSQKCTIVQVSPFCHRRDQVSSTKPGVLSFRAVGLRCKQQWKTHTKAEGFRCQKMSSRTMEKSASNVAAKDYCEESVLSNPYESAMEALSSLITGKKRGNSSHRGKYGKLDRMRMYLKILDLEEDVAGLKIIHVAGTKGKGSTCTFCESILRECGFRTGLFTSPHLIDVRERFRLDGLDISEEKFLVYFWDCWNQLKEHETEDLPMPPLFQFLTVMAFKIFVREQVDVAVIEVGLGGGKDSTNVINEPVVCGITSLGMDHTEILGDTLGQIALHKAGIFKHQVPAFTAPQLSEAMDVLCERAQDLQVPLKVAEPLDVCKFDGLNLSLLGDHQFTNAGLAVSLCKSWLERTGNWNKAFENETGLPEAFCRGLSTAHLSGRGQIVHDYSSKSHSLAQPVERSSGGLVFYLDGAHSPESMEACAKWFSNTVQGNKQCSPSFSPTSYVGQSVKQSGRNGHIQHESGRSKASDELSKKILLFNCMEVRDPEVLLPRLVSTCASSGTYFSKAIFVPSMSTYSKVTSGQSAIPHDFTSKDLSWQINLQRIWERIILGRDIDGLLDKNRKVCRDILPPQDFLHEDASHCSSAERYFSCSAVLPSLPLTIKWLRDCARENPSVTIQVLVTGSLHLVGDVLKILRR